MNRKVFDLRKFTDVKDAYDRTSDEDGTRDWNWMYDEELEEYCKHILIFKDSITTRVEITDGPDNNYTEYVNDTVDSTEELVEELLKEIK